MAMPLPHVAGSFADFVSGSIALACPVAAGLISVPVFVDGAISVPLLVSEGHMQAEGSLSVSIPAVEGYMQAEGTVAASIPSVRSCYFAALYARRNDNPRSAASRRHAAR